MLDEVPSAADFRRWVAQVQMKVCASKRLKEVETATHIGDLEYLPKRWDDLDVALAAALTRVAKGLLQRDTLLVQEEKARQGWIFYVSALSS